MGTDYTGSRKSNGIWAKPLLIIMGVSVATFLLMRLVDSMLVNAQITFFTDLYASELGNLTNPLAGLGEVVIAVLGIEITVIAIIVQLAANKYSSQIMELFVEDRVNIGVIALIVFTGLNTLLVVNSISEDFVPYFSITVMLGMIFISLVVIMPHFNYVFNFLRPVNFLEFVKLKAIRVIDLLSTKKYSYDKKYMNEVTDCLNFIGDVALNSVYQSDRAVTLHCISALRDIAVSYQEKKNDLPEDWFKLTGNEFYDPDFSSFAKITMEKIERNKIILESKIFRLYELLFDNSRTTLRDIATGVLLNSGLIAKKTVITKDKGAMDCALQYFNTYLRIAIRAKDPRSVFTTLEHYRSVAEELLKSQPNEVEKVSFFFKYYGQEASKNQVLFIPETVAYDLCRLNELAYELKVPNMDAMLEFFLSLDDPLEDASKRSTSKENILIGVRIAQTRLAGFYLIHNERDLAKTIYEDMSEEPIERIRKIRDIIYGTKDEEFWEITPRGVNFYYLPPEYKEALKEYFEWFEENNVNQNGNGDAEDSD